MKVNRAEKVLRTKMNIEYKLKMMILNIARLNIPIK